MPGILHVTIKLRVVSCGTDVEIEQSVLPTLIPVEQVTPRRIGAQDQPDLPCALPFLQALLAPDGLRHRFEILVIDEHFHAIPLREALDQPLIVLGHAGVQIAGNPDVEHAILGARENVDAWAFHRGAA